ncbi:MAG: hypothetical protein R3D02_08295 [Hyphomicrobiales bacterium]
MFLSAPRIAIADALIKFAPAEPPATSAPPQTAALAAAIAGDIAQKT